MRSSPYSPFRYATAAGVALLGLFTLGGCSGVPTGDLLLSTEVNLSPLAVLVAPDTVMNTAFTYSDQHPGTFVMPIVGDDMLPRYPKGTALVVQPSDFKTLKRGMTVVYLTRGGGRTAHVLTLQTPDGWATRGFNTKEEDPDLLTEKNYLGTVTMAFAPSAAAVSET